MAYGDKVLDHYENPRNVGTLDKADPNVGTGLVGAPACGDVMRLQVKIGDDGRIEDALRSLPDIAARAVAFDVGNDRPVGNLEFAAGILDGLAIMRHG